MVSSIKAAATESLEEGTDADMAVEIVPAPENFQAKEW